jgi:hypothetical protein
MEETMDLITALRNARRAEMLEPEISISRDILNSEVHVFTDAGRISRPLLIVETVRGADGRERQELKIKKGHIDMMERIERYQKEAKATVEAGVDPEVRWVRDAITGVLGAPAEQPAADTPPPRGLYGWVMSGFGYYQ